MERCPWVVQAEAIAWALQLNLQLVQFYLDEVRENGESGEIKPEMQPDSSGTKGDPCSPHRGWTFREVIVAGRQQSGDRRS